MKNERKNYVFNYRSFNRSDCNNIRILIYNKTTKTNERNMPNMGETQAKPDGDNSEMGEPPSIDNSDNSNMSEPPSKPDGSKSQAPSGSNQSKSSSSETSNS